MTKEEAISEVYGISVTKKQHEALQTLIPELRESEDEWIRKGILAGIQLLKNNMKYTGKYAFGGIPLDNIIAWLLKQKDQKPEAQLTGWVSRDRNGEVYVYGAYPEKDSEKGIWIESNSILLYRRSFLDLKWEDEPVEVEITIKKK